MCFKWFRNLISRPEPVRPEPSGVERPSPKGIIPFSAVEIHPDKVVINQSNQVTMAATNTDSMDPLFDTGHTVFGTEDFDPDELIEGDIVVYHAEGGRLISHRIKEITVDSGGKRFKIEGDNNDRPDPYIIRKQHIKYLVTGIWYTYDNLPV